MKIILMYIVLLVLVFIEVVLIFVEQLYASFLFWIISYMAFVLALFIGYRLYNWHSRIYLAIVFSFIVNANYLVHVPFGAPWYLMVVYSVALLLINGAVFFLIIKILNTIRST